MVRTGRAADETSERVAIYRVAYDEALRVLASQAANLEQMRARIAAVLGTATAATAFLVGVVAGASRADKTTVYWVGVVGGAALYGVTVILTVLMLQPLYTWQFNMSPATIVEGYADAETPATLEETLRTLALLHEDNIRHNEANLGRMRRLFGVSLWMFVAEIACWACLTARVG